MNIICVTGHRPKRLFGTYNLADPRWLALKDKFKEWLIQLECKEAISGMALGTDFVFALAVIELKNSGHDIKLHCAIPCPNQDDPWSPRDKELYQEILKYADEISYVTNEPYTPECLPKRNEFMVDRCDGIIAVWDGSNSGTAITYAPYVANNSSWASTAANAQRADECRTR